MGIADTDLVEPSIKKRERKLTMLRWLLDNPYTNLTQEYAEHTLGIGISMLRQEVGELNKELARLGRDYRIWNVHAIGYRLGLIDHSKDLES